MVMKLLKASCCSTLHLSNGKPIKCSSHYPNCYGSIKSVRAQLLKNTTACLRDGDLLHIEANMASSHHKWVSTKLPQSMGSSLIPFKVSRMTRLVNLLVNGSLKFLPNLMYSNKMTSCFNNCLTKLCLM